MSASSKSAGRNWIPTSYKITIAAQSAAQSSAVSHPGPPSRAMEMPTNARAEVIASLRVSLEFFLKKRG